MNRTTKMLMMNSGKRRRIGVEYEDYAPRDDYAGGRRMYRAPEDRFRDRDGREHYDDGRFSPIRSEGGYWVEGRRDSRGRFARSEYDGIGERYPQRDMPRGWYDENIHGGERPMRRLIGFSPEGGFRGESEGMDASYRPMNEMEHRAGAMSAGHSMSGMVRPMDHQMAVEWTRGMENEDGTRGPHWTMDQTDKVMSQRGVTCDPVQFWVAMNMMYSDYCKIFQKYGVGDKIDFYADMAKAFLDDKDAVPDKLARYFECIVRH